jgi:hypothetical protein
MKSSLLHPENIAMDEIKGNSSPSKVESLTDDGHLSPEVHKGRKTIVLIPRPSDDPRDPLVRLL